MLSGCSAFRSSSYIFDTSCPNSESKMIIQKNQVQAERTERESFGVADTLRLSDAGGLSQYGAYV